MKTMFKIIGKIIKWYIIVDILALAFLGEVRIIETIDENPELGMLDANYKAIDNSINSLKRIFKG